MNDLSRDFDDIPRLAEVSDSSDDEIDDLPALQTVTESSDDEDHLCAD
jgi:hypothetical protein